MARTAAILGARQLRAGGTLASITTGRLVVTASTATGLARADCAGSTSIAGRASLSGRRVPARSASGAPASPPENVAEIVVAWSEAAAASEIGRPGVATTNGGIVAGRGAVGGVDSSADVSSGNSVPHDWQ